MNYETFIKLNRALHSYIMENGSRVFCDEGIYHLLPSACLSERNHVISRYRDVIKGKSTTQKLILLIIIYRYGEYHVFENCKGELATVHSLTPLLAWERHPQIADKIYLFSQFMNRY